MFDGDASAVPERAITMGVGTILDSKRCIGLVTGSEKSEIVAKMLKRLKVPHNVLNAKYHRQEAEIVARFELPGDHFTARGLDQVLDEGALVLRRVIGADGSLVGYGGGLEVKRALLELEGSRPAGQLSLAADG